MHQFNGYQAGRTFLIDRRGLLQCLRRLACGDDYAWELGRRTQLVSELEAARKLLHARQVKLQVQANVAQNKMVDLPASIHLKPGELQIEFYGTEDLLRQMFELSQAIMNDYEKFEQLCESPDVRKSGRPDI